MAYQAPRPLSPDELEARYQHCIGAATRDCTHNAQASVENLVRTLAKGDQRRRRVVFFAETPYFLILRQALCLREAGFETVLACIAPLPEQLAPLFNRAFDHICDDLKSFILFGKIATHVKADIFHLQLWMYTYHHARYVMEKAPDKTVICEFYDVTSTTMPRDKLCEKLSQVHKHAEIIDLDLEMERYIFRNAAGIVHRMTLELASNLIEEYGGEGPTRSLTLYPWPMRAFVPSTDRQRRDPDPASLNLVYVGALHPSNAESAFSTIADLPNLFEHLLGEGHQIDVYSDPYSLPSRNDPAFEYWFELVDRFPNFKIRPGVPPNELPAVLCKYDFGLNVLTNDPASLRNNRLRIENIPGTKLFAYLEGGIPVLTNHEATFLNRFVSEHGVGIAPDWNQLHGLRDYLSQIDIPQLYRNVKRFNRDNPMEEKIKDLIAFYDQAIASNNLHR